MSKTEEYFIETKEFRKDKNHTSTLEHLENAEECARCSGKSPGAD